MTDATELAKTWREAEIRAAKSRIQAEIDRIAARKAEQSYQAATWQPELDSVGEADIDARR